MKIPIAGKMLIGLAAVTPFVALAFPDYERAIMSVSGMGFAWISGFAFGQEYEEKHKPSNN